jgi:hypothetical protein
LLILLLVLGFEKINYCMLATNCIRLMVGLFLMEFIKNLLKPKGVELV